MPLRKQNGLGKTGTLSLCLPNKNLYQNSTSCKKERDWHTGKLRPLCLFVGTNEAFVYIRFIMLCISLGSAAVFDQVLIETCSNSCKCWTEGSSDSDAMMKLKSVSYYSKVLVIFNWYMITSSTAQGGGGSFKNRKSIGQIACCESWMSEQKHWLTDQLANWLSD